MKIPSNLPAGHKTAVGEDPKGLSKEEDQYAALPLPPAFIIGQMQVAAQPARFNNLCHSERQFFHRYSEFPCDEDPAERSQ
jgi:hypothetical protein